MRRFGAIFGGIFFLLSLMGWFGISDSEGNSILPLGMVTKIHAHPYILFSIGIIGLIMSVYCFAQLYFSAYRKVDSAKVVHANSGIVELDLTEEEDADEDDEESVLDIAKRIAKDEWTVLRTHASVLINENYELVWYLLVFIENNGEIEQLVVTDDHDDYLVYFTAKEGDWLLFSTVEDSLSDEGPGDPSDYLKPSKDKSNLDVY